MVLGVKKERASKRASEAKEDSFDGLRTARLRQLSNKNTKSLDDRVPVRRPLAFGLCQLISHWMDNVKRLHLVGLARLSNLYKKSA